MLFRFAESYAHLHEERSTQSNGKALCGGFDSIDETARQHPKEHLRLHVAIGQEIIVQYDLFNLQTRLGCQRLDLIRMKEEDVTIGIGFKLNRFVNIGIWAVREFWN